MTLPSRAGMPSLAALLTTALSASCLALLPLGSASAAGLDPTPPNQATVWLKGQLQGNVLVRTPTTTPASTDFAASFDAATSLAVLGDTATASAIRDALAPQIATWTGLAAGSNANALARTVWTVRALGGDPTTYGATNKVTELRDQVNALPTAPTVPGPDAGKLFDDTAAPTTAGPVDVIGQAYAAGAFARELPADPVTPYVTSYLLKQQCIQGAGFFTQAFAASGATCDSTLTKTASVEATAAAVVALTPRVADPTIKAAYDKAVGWLVSVQQSNGRWTPTGTDGPGDAVTTGIAAYAVSLAGRAGPASQAAVWLRGQQLVNAGTCPGYPAADLGAVALDTPSFDTAPTTAISSSPARQASFRRSTARAVGALKATPAGDLGTASAVSVPKFSKPGKAVVANVRSSARNTLCATVPGTNPAKLVVAYNGTASYAFFAPAAGALTTTVVDTAGQSASATVTSLGKKKLGFSFRSKKVRTGKVAVVKVKGLAAGENAKVQFRGKRKDTAVANSSGQAKLRFIVTGKRGFVKVRVAGEYSNRNRTKNLIVTRR